MFFLCNSHLLCFPILGSLGPAQITKGLLWATHTIRKSNPKGRQSLNCLIRKCWNFIGFCSKNATTHYCKFCGLHDANLINKFGFFTFVQLRVRFAAKTNVFSTFLMVIERTWKSQTYLWSWRRAIHKSYNNVPLRFCYKNPWKFIILELKS